MSSNNNNNQQNQLNRKGSIPSLTQDMNNNNQIVHNSVTWHAGMPLGNTVDSVMSPADRSVLLKSLNSRLSNTSNLPAEFRTMSMGVSHTIQANNSKKMQMALNQARKDNASPLLNVPAPTGGDVGSPPSKPNLPSAVPSPSSSSTIAPQELKSTPLAGDTNYFASLDTHKLSAVDVAIKFSTDSELGISNFEAQKRLAQYGPNQLATHTPNYFKKVFFYLFGGFCSVLWVGVLVFFLCWQPLSNPPSMVNFALAILVLIVILIQALFSAFQDWSTGRVMKSILNMLPSECFVIRDGQTQKIPTSQVVVGDLVQLNLGNKIPADIVILGTADLKVDNSVLTGESLPVNCTTQCTDENFLESKNVCFMGTHVVNGSGVGIVVSTGNATVMGRINRLTGEAKEKVPLIQTEINRFVGIIVLLTIILAFIFVLEWGVFLRVKHPNFQNTVAMLMNVMSCVVAFIPEGMPICVALTLLMVANRMKENDILPKALTTVETLGCVNVICSDKTGTLTQNRMTVVSVGFSDGQATADQVKEYLEQEQGSNSTSTVSSAYRQIQMCSILCNNSTWDQGTIDQPDIANRLINGDATDSAIFRFGHRMFPEYKYHLEVQSLESEFTRVHDLPFNSKNKYMMTAYQSVSGNSLAQMFGVTNHNQELLLIVKGAPDVLLPKCTHVLLSNSDQVVKLSSDYLEKIQGVQEKWARGGQRVILLTKRIVCPSTSNPVGSSAYRQEVESFGNQDLTVIGLIGLMDPPRPEIPNTVATCRRSGSRFFMVTGDFSLTAASIARQIGIYTTDLEPHTYDDLLIQASEHEKFVKDLKEKESSQTDQSSLSSEQSTIIKRLLSKIKKSKSKDEDDSSFSSFEMEPFTIRSTSEPTSLLLTGSDLEKIQTNKQLWNQVFNYDEIVFARTTPEHKLRIVKEFQHRGSVVAVTGDGVNDAPALKAADVGVAVVSGSDVAIEAADLVLLGSFESITQAMRLGRLVFQNLQKVIGFLLPAGSWSEIMPVVVNAFFGTPCPLSSFLMIIICCFTDLFPCLSLIMEHEETDLMAVPPRNSKKDHLITLRIYIQSYLFMGMLLTIISQGLFFSYLYEYTGLGWSDLVFTYGDIDFSKAKVTADEFNLVHVPIGTCVTFIALVILQWGNILAIRNRNQTILKADPIRQKRRNLWIFVGMLFSFVIALIVTKVPWFQSTFATGDVPIKYWLLPLPFALLVLLLDETRKFFVRHYPGGPIAYIAW
ncbi:hypothetical protein DFA_09533 [Cavenderia fasciculata]|uniref:Cation-transporting P-type ATPase N-terminal domain-containing protein n=1 Tax=Cavenderia fasciculata TaxID=261658 RepID=F4Q7W4_CACFS|nr:uncharacterized protein DFA_09533 [Cavenderia fasciculata]EGG15864.1 hypothetical protein DFA_09533 [Cavenderia fasciculata]|eukprot:XP_004352189.1 hypothetical protein DFA_09533 [Cavenderia fasciculata]